MRCLQAVIGLLSLLAAGYLFVAAARTPATSVERPEPALTVTPAAHDFGEVTSPDDLTARFEITNTYDQPAEVVSVMKGCSCASAAVEPQTIPAGGTATLTVMWRVAGKHGRISETVVPVCKIGDRTEHLRARVSARMVLPVEPDREVIELDRSKRPERVVFRARDGRPFRLTGSGANHPSLATTIDPDGRSLTVTFDPSQPGWESGRLAVTVATDMAGAESVTIYVRANP
ncbi:MAG: DUF1573 domain-containing protein [Gemmataceae bacterium]|nr:DUF1573 domain-containing protein [Gemmataceae bacterium]